MKSGTEGDSRDAVLRIRRATVSDHEALAALWRRSVEATHHFLTAVEVERLFHDVLHVYLPGVETVWLAEFLCAAGPAPTSGDSGPAGFIGCNGAHVEMLFVEPARFRRGVGQSLLAHAGAGRVRLTLDVNEENPQALAFYQRQGFRIVGRSPLDGQGRPYPLLHMERSAGPGD